MSPWNRPSWNRLREHPLVVAVIAVIILIVLLVHGFLAGRSEAAAEAESERTVTAAVRISPNIFGPPTLILSPEVQRSGNIGLAQPKPAPYQHELQAYASILELQAFTDLGNTLASANAQRAIAEAKLDASRAAFQRARALYENNQNFSRAQLQAAEATFRSDEATLRAAQVQAQNAAASAYQAWGAVLGASLAGNTALARELAHHKKVLIQVTLPLGTSLPASQSPGAASIETPPGQRVRIDFISAAISTDPRIQGASYFYTADAASGLLPGMNVIAYLPAGRPLPGISIPPSAVVWLQGRAWVYVRTGATAFTRREIATTQPQPNGGYVVAAATGPSARVAGARPTDTREAARAFPQNATIVVKGAQLLLSQEFSSQIQTGGD